MTTMTTPMTLLFDQLASLMAFPRRDLAPLARVCASDLRGWTPEAAAALDRFAEKTDHETLSALQEQYSAAFDFDPACSLELGWHAFGRTFERCEFLVQLRDDLVSAGVPETEGLPDHLVHVLGLLPREVPARAEAHAALLGPAITGIRTALEKRGSLYADLLTAIETAIASLRANRPQEANTP